MDEVDRIIINRLQIGFPVCDRPYLQIANELELTEKGLIQRIQYLLDSGILTRFGPMFHAEQMGGALTLAAIKAPAGHYDAVTEIVNSFPEVAHNYQRTHELNMWFVIATETPQQLTQTIQAIEEKTGLTVYNMPKQREYFVNLFLEA